MGCTHLESPVNSESSSPENKEIKNEEIIQEVVEMDHLRQNDWVKFFYTIDTQNLNAAQPDIYRESVVWSGGNIRDEKSLHLLNSIWLYNLETDERQLIAETRIGGQTKHKSMNSGLHGQTGKM
jgi:hypothetical protein